MIYYKWVKIMDNVKLEDLIYYFRNYDLSKIEILYLLNLYKLSKSLEIDQNEKINMEDLVLQFSKLNELLKTANKTSLVYERLNKEIDLLKKANDMIQNEELDRITELYNEIAFLSFESGVDINYKKSKKILKYNLEKRVDKSAGFTR